MRRAAWIGSRSLAVVAACAIGCGGGGGAAPGTVDASVGSGGSTPSSAGHAADPVSGSGGSAISAGSGGSGHAAAGHSGGTGGAMTSPTGSGGTSVRPVVDAGNADAGAASGPMRLQIAVQSIPAGGEAHVCVTLAAPNDEVAWVQSIHAVLTKGSHHLIVDRKPVGTTLQPQVAECSPTMGGDSTRLIIAQQPDTVVDAPEGTAFRLEPHQPIFLQLHYINVSEAASDISGTVELEFADASAGTPIEVKSLFTGATNISLDPGAPGTAEFFLMPQGTASRPWQVFAITSHTHALGVDSTIERVPNANAPDSTPIHESLDWREPPLTQFDPPLVFSGQDGLRLRCHYQNTTDHQVNFGTRFEDEMCFLWLYYFEKP